MQDIAQVNRHVQNSCRHHILGDAVPCSKICGKDDSQTLKTASRDERDGITLTYTTVMSFQKLILVWISRKNMSRIMLMDQGIIACL